jgi:hypothetical protein
MKRDQIKKSFYLSLLFHLNYFFFFFFFRFLCIFYLKQEEVKKKMSSYYQQQESQQQQPSVSHMGPPPNLPSHYERMSPSPTPTVKPHQEEDPYYHHPVTEDKFGEKQGLIYITINY